MARNKHNRDAVPDPRLNITGKTGCYVEDDTGAPAPHAGKYAKEGVAIRKALEAAHQQYLDDCKAAGVTPVEQ